MNMRNHLKIISFLLILLGTFQFTHAKSIQAIKLFKYDTTTHNNASRKWRFHQEIPQSENGHLDLEASVIVAGMLCFLAASVSSAGGIGGGGLFVPILTIIAGFDLKKASGFSAFMVTGGSIANVIYNMFIKRRGNGSNRLIDYDIALLSEPFMLLGVSIGVICNTMFPEWLITILFAVFLAWSTSKTCRSGVKYWKKETERARLTESQNLRNIYAEEISRIEEALLEKKQERSLDIPWLKLGMLLIIWLSFFFLNLLHGNRFGQGIIPVEACGVIYWIITSMQLPLAIIFTAWILYSKQNLHTRASNEQESGDDECKGALSAKLIFPLMALIAGGLGGVFGIGGGMLISPLLLQVGLQPEVTAATCSFMVFFSSTMSSIEYLLLGMEDPFSASIYAVLCFLGSLIGLLIVQKAIRKHGRASLIVFSVGIVLALSSVLMTSFGAFDVWQDYTSGAYMGFSQPC
ncbi:hypothetical protein Leryth_025154 [Lithospermum erythrorhizon]|nr:hypothetical protein Leryth_025154 [Lithospermum erythrorhizon]